MASVLLVDDEKNIRKGLYAIISKSGTNFTDIDECSNGYSALQMIARKQYDLLITDLIMPKMDGIELLSRIAESDCKPYTVILSAHDDFKYAQKAIKFGVKAYLLKPVDREELYSILKKAKAELASKQESTVPANPLTEFCENQLSLILHNENLSKEEILKIMDVCGLNCAGQDYAVAVVNFCDTYEFPEKRESNSAIIPYIKQLIADMHVTGYSLADRNGNIVVILDKKADIEELLDNIEKTYGKSYSAGLSCLSGDPSHIRLSYNRAEYALRCRLLNPGAKILNHADISHTETEPVIPVRLIKNLTEMLDADRKDDLSKLVYRIFDENIIMSSRLGYLEKLSATLKDEIIQYLSEHIPHKTDFIKEKEDTFKGIYEFRDVREYILYVLSYVMNINDTLLKIKHTYRPDDEIDQALKFINENYAKDLSMAEVANRIGLNYSYFSLLFKERTGVNFVEYLKMVRMRKAMELLAKSDYRIYEISEMVGYNNIKHFTTIFREFTGISPKEYRERIYV
ncbi:MAG: response regulator [Bacillota bacterium]